MHLHAFANSWFLTYCFMKRRDGRKRAAEIVIHTLSSFTLLSYQHLCSNCLFAQIAMVAAVSQGHLPLLELHICTWLQVSITVGRYTTKREGGGGVTIGSTSYACSWRETFPCCWWDIVSPLKKYTMSLVMFTQRCQKSGARLFVFFLGWCLDIFNGPLTRFYSQT